MYYVARGLHLVTIQIPEPTKSGLMVKPDYEDKARAVFNGSDVNITVEGRKYLGSPRGTLAFCESFSVDKVSEWTQELEDLAKIAANDPQVCYTAFVFGLNKRWLMVISHAHNTRDRPSVPTTRAMYHRVLPGHTVPRA